jgi:hypothetical protein
MAKFLFAKKKTAAKAPFRITDPLAIVDETKYQLGDGKIKNPADYFDIAKLTDKRHTSREYDARANPTSIPLSSRCHPQEVYLQAIQPLWDPKTRALPSLFKTMCNCRDFGNMALKNGDYERACILFGRGIGLTIGLLSLPNLESLYGARAVEAIKQVIYRSSYTRVYKSKADFEPFVSRTRTR